MATVRPYVKEIGTRMAESPVQHWSQEDVIADMVDHGCDSALARRYGVATGVSMGVWRKNEDGMLEFSDTSRAWKSIRRTRPGDYGLAPSHSTNGIKEGVSAPAPESSEPPSTPSTARPTTQAQALLDLCSTIGIPADKAQGAVGYLAMVADLGSADSVYRHIQKAPGLLLNDKKNLATAWFASQNIPVPPPIQQALDLAPDGTYTQQGYQQQSGPPKRRFMAVAGEIHALDPGDMDGVSMVEASMMAESQREKLKATTLLQQPQQPTQQAQATPFDGVLGALVTRFSEWLVNPPTPAPQTLMPVDGLGNVSVEVWEKVQDRADRREMFAAAKGILPEFLATMRDVATASKNLAAKRGDQIPGEEPIQVQEQEEVQYIERNCVNCQAALVVPIESPFLVCAQCQTPQTSDGQVLEPVPVNQVEEPLLEVQEAPIEPQLEPEPRPAPRRSRSRQSHPIEIEAVGGE